MKLSEKGLHKIEDEMERGEYQIPCGYENVEGMSIYHLEEHEFEPDDFQDAVILTVEEAIFTVRVLHTVWDAYCISMNQECYNKIKEINQKLIRQVNKVEGKE